MSGTTSDGTRSERPQGGTVAIVGAGLAGSLLAVLLGRQGWRVQVYERRDDPRTGQFDEGRSINLGISARGILALREVDLWDKLAEHRVPMRGRMIHKPDGTLRFQPYGIAPEEILHSVRRNELNALLVDRAEREPEVSFHFGHRCVDLDRDTGQLTVADARTGATTTVAADLVVGADGAFSVVRERMQRGLPADYRQDFLSWGYRELTIPANPDGTARTPIEALHLWPSRYGLIVAHPNCDRSLTCTVLLPHHDDPQRPAAPSFDSLTNEAAVRTFFGGVFPDTMQLIPNLAEEFLAHPVGHLVSIRTSPWHHRDRVVLVGDACHAVYPFYGQGMNAAFEDCLVLADCLRRGPERAAALAAYQDSRKPHTDVLADLAEDNFVELRDRVRSPWHVLLTHADQALHRLLPQHWQPLYRLISHTTTPYRDALERSRRQHRMLAATGGALAATAAAAAVASRLTRGARRG